jgi:hypothetical protein
MTKAFRGVLVTSNTSVNGSSGGQQICTSEYRDVLAAAGIELSVVTFDWNRAFLTRVKRRLVDRPYHGVLPGGLCISVAAKVKEENAAFVFLNVADVAPLAIELKSVIPQDCQVVLLSHGMESVDYLHTARVRGDTATRKSELRLGRQLFAELAQRQNIDYVFCLASFEAEIERWLGAKRVEWLPRVKSRAEPLNWRPLGTRLGCVSTLDHPPNREGIELLLDELDTSESGAFEFRIVGGPAKVGHDMAQRHRNVKYLGQVSNSELKREASTWNAFVHPLFCYARGCSTKLATALSWQIPIVTTPEGARGYVWREGNLPMAQSPSALAELALTFLDDSSAAKARADVQQIAETMPSLQEIAQRVRDILFVE